MKRIVPIIIILFLGISLVSGIEIESCKSEGKNNWECGSSDICVCRISGGCTDGRLLVYETDVRNLFPCMPKIINGYADIIWDNCDNPTGEVKVRADCSEGQSSQKTINIISPEAPPPQSNGHHGTTTTITTTTTISCNYVCQTTCVDDNNPPFCYRRMVQGTGGCPGGTICCQSILKECPKPQAGTTILQDKTCPYDCCVDTPGYEYKPCRQGLICYNNICKEAKSPGFSLPGSLIFWVVLASLLPIIAFFIFVLKKDRDQNIPEF